MTQPDVLADAPQNPESTETPAIDYDALAEALMRKDVHSPWLTGSTVP